MNSQAKTENEPYTPTTEEMLDYVLNGTDVIHRAVRREQFNRWLAQHDAEVLAAARPSWEAESREALVQAIDVELARSENWHPAATTGLEIGATSRIADALLANGVVTLATPTEEGAS